MCVSTRKRHLSGVSGVTTRQTHAVRQTVFSYAGFCIAFSLAAFIVYCLFIVYLLFISVTIHLYLIYKHESRRDVHCQIWEFHVIPTFFKILTYSMVQSPSWAANWFAASQEIPPISRNPKVHYRTHKRPPSVPILPVHIPTSHLLEIHPNIIHPSTHRSPQWSSSLRFPHQDPIHPLSSPIRATLPFF